VHDAAPQPEPAPVKAKATTMAKAGKAVEEMTAEEYAAARKRNSNQVSSTSFADDDALGIDNGASAAKAPPKAQPKSEPKTAAKAPAETKTAALQPAKAPEMSGDVMQIVFPAGDSVLPPAAETPLAALAAQLAQDTSLRLQLKAYAGGDADAASHARRLSLSRALSVRSHLIEAGVRSTRIDVRALGNKSESGPADRVDVFLVTR
jgi:outer membrane protein OmpA-like peptidoglycan-associated protein